MSRMITRSMTDNTSTKFLELPDNRDESGSESEYETDTCSESDPDYTDEMVLVTDNEETDLNSSIDSLSSSIDHHPTVNNKKMKYVLPKYLEDLEEEALKEYNKQVAEVKQINKNDIPLQFKVMRTKIDIHEKARIIKLIETYEKSKDRDSDYTKITQFINTIVDLPFGKYNEIDINSKNSENINDYILKTENTLNTIIYGHREAKLEILQYICRIIRNPVSTGTSLGIYGPAGIGKTTC